MDPYLGAILQFAFGFAPRNWAQCNGQLLAIAQNQALFALLGTYYGGNGVTTFALPDLRGRVPIGQGQGPGLPGYDIGEPVGTQAVTLSIANMPQHKHIINASSETGDAGNPDNAFFANTNVKDNEYKISGTEVAMNTAMMVNAGGSLPVSIMQPYAVVNYCIALQGIFPSRD